MAAEVEQILGKSTYNPINRFMIFCGDKFYPSGGMSDFYTSTDTLDQAKEELLKRAMVSSFDWAHVYDSHESKLVWEHKVIGG